MVGLHLQIADFLILYCVGYERCLEMIDDEVSIRLIVNQYLSLVSLSLIASFVEVRANSNT